MYYPTIGDKIYVQASGSFIVTVDEVNGDTIGAKTDLDAYVINGVEYKASTFKCMIKAKYIKVVSGNHLIVDIKYLYNGQFKDKI